MTPMTRSNLKLTLYFLSVRASKRARSSIGSLFTLAMFFSFPTLSPKVIFCSLMNEHYQAANNVKEKTIKKFGGGSKKFSIP